MKNSTFVQRGGLWVAAQGVLFLGLIASGIIWRRQWVSSATDILAWLFLAGACICGIAGAVALGRNLTPFPRPAQQARLVQRGVYSLVRHPLYTSVISGALAWSLFAASWPALGGALVLAVFFDAKARREERWLREHFPEYRDYESRVRRFMPWVY